MDRFSSFSHEPDDPWFRVGNVDVSSSVLVAALSAVSMFVYAIDKSVLSWLWLISDGGPIAPASFSGVRQGQVWRLVTWPFYNPPSVWTAISIALIWYFGRELERHLGRVRYLWFLGISVVLPAIGFVVAVPSVIDQTGIVTVMSGAGFLSSAIIAAFVVTYPTIQSFFGVPFWVLAVVVEAITFLQLAGDRLWDGLWLLLLLLAVSILAARAFGLSELEWIPKLPLPAALSGSSRPRRPSRRARRSTARSGPATVTPIHRPATPTSAELLRQAEIDILLDKINEHGIGSLTPEERRRLDEHSRRMRDERP